MQHDEPVAWFTFKKTSDIESIDKLIDEYDKKYLNWNHDFPIFGFMSILKNGLLFPNIAFSGGGKKNGVGFNKILSDGTHRLFMTAMSGSDYPMFVQVPKNQTKFITIILVIYLNAI